MGVEDGENADILSQ
jgi:predicted RNase H-like nuclease (RuvC/YqgF family)